MKSSIFTLGILFLSAQATVCAAADLGRTPGIRLIGLKDYVGQRVTPFVTSGRDSAVGTPGRLPIVAVVLGRGEAAEIDSSGFAFLRPFDFLRASGVRGANMTIFLVHPATPDGAPQYITTADGSCPPSSSVAALGYNPNECVPGIRILPVRFMIANPEKSAPEIDFSAIR